ncbi:MAG: FAD binding domain-containing protein [Lachnospiraceae bacterium]|nr:FAD binding domain-containing protein [Lachnospiraceae bacterium]
MMTIKNYVRPETLEEAWQLNQKRTNRIIGGMLWLKMGSGNVNTVIDLSDLELNAIEETEEEFFIGAYATLRQLELHAGLNTYTNCAVRDAVKDIIGVQFRNLATVGGSIWGRFGFSDVLTVFLSMDCYVELYKGGIVPLPEFAQMKKDNDILLRLIVKKLPGAFCYNAVRIQRTDFPVLTCAASEINGTIRLSIGARPGKALIVADEEELLKEGITEECAAAFAEYAAAHVKTEGNIRGSAAYRTQLIRVLTRRTLLALKGGEAC